MLGRRSSSGRHMPISGRRRPTGRRRGGTLWLGLFAISRTLLGGHADGRGAIRRAGTVLRVLLACPAAMGRNEVLRFAGVLWRTDAAGVAQRAHVADQGDRRYRVPPGVKRIQSCDSDRLAGTRWMEANRDNRVGHLRPSAGTTKPVRSSPQTGRAWTDTRGVDSRRGRIRATSTAASAPTRAGAAPTGGTGGHGVESGRCRCDGGEYPERVRRAPKGQRMIGFKVWQTTGRLPGSHAKQNARESRLL